MKTAGPGVDLIKHWEGFSASMYLCPAQIPTRGFGFIRAIDGSPLTMESGPISNAEAEYQLKHELTRFEKKVAKLITVPITQNMHDALVSFSFNLGSYALKSSTLRRKLNREDYDGAAGEFRRWVFAGGRRLRGLVRRRADEAALFGL